MREVQQKRALATRQHILDSAAAVFDSEGFAGASLGRIVRHAGTTRGALHFHFPTKEALANAVVDEHNRRITAVVEGISRSDVSALEQMMAISELTARQIDDDPVVRAGTRLLMEMTYSEAPPLAYRVWIEACERLVRKAVSDGDLAPTVSPEAVAHLVISSLAGTQMVTSVLSGRGDLHQRVEEMWEIILHGLVPTDRRGRVAALLRDRAALTD
ncbi:ScbR family autoregulator-binding transcription factor [Streptomyces profundus]|uniref:ScbR family autoregulator-binding transcription factor n=1 Tax=Streptomyces profundus TaxID=2867410 RepID=UPI001D16DAD5|nr:ScbR family autoregulator-binding transcription factor [Streptomyces sp. MA3_2.13]UED88026.1 TetR/AcrR family transcriptional regulator [Streptomyces sp. MA3_2.13]